MHVINNGREMVRVVLTVRQLIGYPIGFSVVGLIGATVVEIESKGKQRRKKHAFVGGKRRTDRSVLVGTTNRRWFVNRSIS